VPESSQDNPGGKRFSLFVQTVAEDALNIPPELTGIRDWRRFTDVG
jgi:hypothetical protein